MSTAAPFLNSYKLKFLRKRLVQNALSGLILNFDSAEDAGAPWFIYSLQLLLFFTPVIVGGVSLLVADLAYPTEDYRLIISLIVGGCYFICLTILKLTCLFVNNAAHSKEISTSKTTRPLEAVRTLNDESNYIFDASMCSMTTLNFILPSPDVLHTSDTHANINKLKLMRCVARVLVDSAVAGFLMFAGIYLESINYLTTYYSTGGAVCILIFNWVVLVAAFYSLCVREPPEPAIYQPYDSSIQHYTRAFYVALFQIIELIYK